jgi:hypothetical protein
LFDLYHHYIEIESDAAGCGGCGERALCSQSNATSIDLNTPIIAPRTRYASATTSAKKMTTKALAD